MDLLQPENYVLTYRGSSKTLELTVRAEDGSAVDLTGARIVFSVKTDVTDRNAVILKDSAVGADQAEIITPRAGVARIYIQPSDTQNLDVHHYVFDVWIVLATGQRYPVVAPSVFEVLPAVTVIPA